MKNRIKYLSKSSLSTVLALCMLLSCVYIGLIPTNAAYVDSEEKIAAVDNSEAVGYSDLSRLYFDNTKTNYGTVYCYVGKGDYAKSYTMTNTGHHNIWYLDISGWGDRTKMYFANHNDSPNGQNFGIDTQYNWNTTGSTRTALITCANNDGGSCFIPSGNNSSSVSRQTLRVVSGDLSSNGWDDYSDLMTYSSSQWTKTYSNVNSGNYSLAVVGFYNDWNPSYRWSAKGTLTANNAGSWADANDNNHNIKLTLTKKADVTVTLTSSNKVDITLTPIVTPSVTISSNKTIVYTDGDSATITTSVENSSATPSYTVKKDGSTATSSQYTFSNGIFTPKVTGSFVITASITDGSTYTDSVTITASTRSIYFKKSQLSGTSAVNQAGTLMTYDSASGLYKLPVSLDYGSSGNWYYIVVYDSSNNGGAGENLSMNNGELTETLLTTAGYNIYSGNDNVNNPLHIVATITGTYNFYFDPANDRLYVEYPRTVTFSANGHGTAPSSQVVAYGGKATTPTAPTATGWTFGGWYKESTCANAWNFSTDTVTENKTLYAKWTVNSHSITYPSTTTGYTLAGTKPASANYGTSVSFTVTADTGYRIKSVKYKYGSTTANCTAGGSGSNEYHFTMPNADVEVLIEAVRQYTVTLTTSTKKIDQSSLSANAGFASRKYKIDNGTQISYTQAFNVDAGSTVTFYVTYNDGYGFNSVSDNVTDVNHQTFTVTVNDNETVTLEAGELSRTVMVYKRLYTQNRASYSTVEAQTITDVGVVTSKTVNAADATADNGNYGFTEFSFDSNVITGSPNGRSAFSITTKNNATIYIDYDEVLYTLTINVSPQGKGSVKKGNTAYSSLQVGNVTGAVLTAVPIAGYQFSSWTQTGTPTTTAPSTATYNRIKIKGNTTLTANFEEITHTITLKKRYWLVEGDTRRQLDSGVDLGITFSGAGMYTPIEITAPKVRNCTFMDFDLGSYSNVIKSADGSDLSNEDLKKSPIEVTATADAEIYADYKVSGNIDIYVDMNDNVGTPILNLMYFADSNGNPVPYTSVDNNGNPNKPSTAVIAYLPYEMELVTGSESIYKYTLKVSKLREDYKIGKHVENNTTILDLINISYITVENVKIGESSGGFKIDPEAYTTGEMWLKADSTKLKTFNTLSYGSVTNTFIGLFGDGDLNSNHTKLDSAIKSVNGTSIHTDDDEIYHAQYAGLYRVTKNNVTTLINNFHYTLKVSLNKEVTQNGTTYYFDKWIKCPTANLSAANGVYSFSSSSQIEGDPQSPDLNFTHALEYSAGDYVYIALYKPASNSEVRVEVTYNFKDFNSADGNYVYEADKTVPASYTKTIRVPVGTGQPYADFAAVKAAVNAIASANVPYVKSNYFNYSYKANSATVDNDKTSSAESKIVATAELEETAREYTIIVKDGNSVYTTETGYYQQSVTLTNNKQNPVWKDNAGNIIATGATYKAIFVSNANDNNGTDCQIIKIDTQANASVTNKSVVQNSFTEVYYDGSTEKLRHNFYIIDYCTEGTLLGGGVLYATTDGTDYRQSSAATNLGAYATPTSQASITTRTNFITNILKAGTQTIDYSTEYKAQTIDNIGFRYKPFKSTEDVFRYSDDLGAYLTMFEGTNVNSSDYDGQKLRLFSFMLYNNNGTTIVVPSDGYAEVDRYQPQSQS